MALVIIKYLILSKNELKKVGTNSRISTESISYFVIIKAHLLTTHKSAFRHKTWLNDKRITNEIRTLNCLNENIFFIHLTQQHTFIFK